MEATLGLLKERDGNGETGISEVSPNDPTLLQMEVGKQDHVVSESSEETELELGLGLSLCTGDSAAKIKSTACRILTAKDFPSGPSSSPSSSRFPFFGSVSGTKRAADSVSQEGGSPPGFGQVVGWPPIRAYRMNSLVNQAKTPRPDEEKEDAANDKSKDAFMKKIFYDSRGNATVKAKENIGFVKVNVDGVLIGRKIDLKAHSSYDSLAQMLEDMFFRPTKTCISPGPAGEKEQEKRLYKLLDGSSEFVLTYEDKEGDWMLVGDVPWEMFLSSVKKLRIMRTAEAKGLAPRCQGRNER